MNFKKILALGLCATFAVSCLTACGKIKEDPKATVEQYVQDTVKGEEVNKMYSLLTFNETVTNDAVEDEEDKATIKSMQEAIITNVANRISVTIKDTQIDDKAKTAIVTADISGVDMKSCMEVQQQLFTDYMGELITSLAANAPPSEEEMENKLTNIIINTVSNEKVKSLVQTVKFNLSYDKTSKNWVVISTDIPLANVILGNYKEATEFADELNKEVIDTEKDIIDNKKDTAEDTAEDIIDNKKDTIEITPIS